MSYSAQDMCLLLRQDICLCRDRTDVLLLRRDRCEQVGQGGALSHFFTSVLFQQKTFVLSQQQTSVLSQQQTSALAFITQHQHLVSTITILWRLRQQPTSGYHEGWDIKRPCAPMVAMIPTGYGFGYSQTRMT